MKTLKKVLLIFAIIFLTFIAIGCSTDDGSRYMPECECTRTNYEVTFQIVGSQTFWFTEELDSTIVPCQDEVQQVYYYEVNDIRRYYNITCINSQRELETIWTTMCSGGGVWVTKSNHGHYKINGIDCTQQEAEAECRRING